MRGAHGNGSPEGLQGGLGPCNGPAAAIKCEAGVSATGAGGAQTLAPARHLKGAVACDAEVHLFFDVGIKPIVNSY